MQKQVRLASTPYPLSIRLIDAVPDMKEIARHAATLIVAGAMGPSLASAPIIELRLQASWQPFDRPAISYDSLWATHGACCRDRLRQREEIDALSAGPDHFKAIAQRPAKLQSGAQDNVGALCLKVVSEADLPWTGKLAPALTAEAEGAAGCHMDRETAPG